MMESTHNENSSFVTSERDINYSQEAIFLQQNSFNMPIVRPNLYPVSHIPHVHNSIHGLRPTSVTNFRAVDNGTNNWRLPPPCFGPPSHFETYKRPHFPNVEPRFLPSYRNSGFQNVNSHLDLPWYSSGSEKDISDGNNSLHRRRVFHHARGRGMWARSMSNNVRNNSRMESPFINEDIALEMEKKQQLYHRAKMLNTEESWKALKKQKNLVTRMMKEAKKNLKMSNVESNKEKFYCDTCDRLYAEKKNLDDHLAEHVKCLIDGCKFEAHNKVVVIHRKMQHDTGLAKKIMNLNTPEEIEKWRSERRKKYPTKSNIARKNAELAEKTARGEVIETKYFGKIRRRVRDRRNPNHNHPVNAEKDYNNENTSSPRSYGGWRGRGQGGDRRRSNYRRRKRHRNTPQVQGDRNVANKVTEEKLSVERINEETEEMHGKLKRFRGTKFIYTLNVEFETDIQSIAQDDSKYENTQGLFVEQHITKLTNKVHMKDQNEYNENAENEQDEPPFQNLPSSANGTGIININCDDKLQDNILVSSCENLDGLSPIVSELKDFRRTTQDHDKRTINKYNEGMWNEQDVPPFKSLSSSSNSIDKFNESNDEKLQPNVFVSKSAESINPESEATQQCSNNMNNSTNKGAIPLLVKEADHLQIIHPNHNNGLASEPIHSSPDQSKLSPIISKDLSMEDETFYNNKKQETLASSIVEKERRSRYETDSIKEEKEEGELDDSDIDEVEDDNKTHQTSMDKYYGIKEAKQFEIYKGGATKTSNGHSVNTDPLSYLLKDCTGSDSEEELVQQVPVSRNPLTAVGGALGSLMASYGGHGTESENEVEDIKEMKSSRSKTTPSSGTSKVSKPQPLQQSKPNLKKEINLFPISHRRLTLLEKLLAKEIRHERNIIFQCVRYIVQNNFFEERISTPAPSTNL
ncbi:nuclear FMR1 interacting protein 1 isoform X2 [Tachypleus tridentatus]|uniref:nuclear FMR1 interacting protein 1 isoform X2 n=1 Tax=Tachypleus tridentatus TaxID=6853 RepID=UPI003FD270C1